MITVLSKKCGSCLGEKWCPRCGGYGRLLALARNESFQSHVEVCPDCCGDGGCQACNGSGVSLDTPARFIVPRGAMLSRAN